MTTTNENTTVLETPTTMIPPNALQAEHGIGGTIGQPDFDYVGWVRGIAEGQKKTGTLQFMRGNGLFNSCCQAAKSKLGTRPQDKLGEKVVASIKLAIELVQNECLNAVTGDNLSSMSIKLRRMGNVVVKETVLRGRDSVSFNEQIEEAKRRIKELTARRDKATERYDDEAVTKIESTIRAWNHVIAVAKFEEKEQASLAFIAKGEA